MALSTCSAVTAPAGKQKSMSDGKMHQLISTNCSRSCSSYWCSLSAGTLFATLDHREVQPADGAAVRSLFPTVGRAGARDGAGGGREGGSAAGLAGGGGRVGVAGLAAEAGRQEAAARRGAGDEIYEGGSRCRCCSDPQRGTTHQRPARMRPCVRLLSLRPHPDFVGECAGISDALAADLLHAIERTANIPLALGRLPHYRARVFLDAVTASACAEASATRPRSSRCA